MTKVNFFVLVFLSIISSTLAQDVVLKGNALEYAGETLSFFTYSDWITNTEAKLTECKVDEQGNFLCSFSTNETLYVYVKLGVYEAYIFIEPEKEYEIILPERKEKTRADLLNPYFTPILYHLGFEKTSKEELNYQLAYFDEIYKMMFEKTSYAIYNKDPRLDVDLEISSVDTLFKNVRIKYFRDFKKYQFASYRHFAYQQKSKSISNTYYLNNEILYENPAYMKLFNQVYKDYFQYFGRTKSGQKIFKDIAKYKSITLLKETLGQDSILTNEALKELVILKCLHDEFYNDVFSRSAMLTVLDSLALQTSFAKHKRIAENIRKKVTKLMVGFYPPEFKLYDKDNNLITLNSFKGEYVYLGFCTTASYACIKEFEMLRNFYKHHKNHFKIVFICLDESLEQMKKFVEKKNYPFTFLHYGNQSKVFQDYDIRTYPTYYFIDKEGKLKLSPAPSIDQKLEFAIYKILKANGDI
ncbi:MAG: TlpA family protein disulfide reductase [Bacteroidales bacterium]|nr:TlpA family protein disulfide reductase [Bacteroidales bacterium]